MPPEERTTPASRIIGASRTASGAAITNELLRESVESQQLLARQVMEQQAGIRANAEMIGANQEIYMRALQIIERLEQGARQGVGNAREMQSQGLDLAVMLNQAGFQNAPQVSIGTENISAQMLRELQTVTQTARGTAIGDLVGSAAEELGRGQLGSGLAGFHNAISQLQASTEEWGERETRLIEKMLQMTDDWRKLAVEAGVEIRDAQGRIAGAAGGGSIVSRAGETMMQGILGDDPARGATQQLLGLIPGGDQGPLGQIGQGMLQQFGGNILGKVPAPVLMGAGAAAAIGTAAYQQWQAFEQQRREWAGLAGGMSGGEALSLDMRTRAMALSPFMDRKQAQAIVSAGLREGYVGGELDQAIGFSTEMHGSYNMGAEESMKLYNAAVHEAGASTIDVTSALDKLAETARNTDANMEELRTGFTATVETLKGFGVSGPAVTTAAEFIQSSGADIEGFGRDEVAAAFGNQYFQLNLASAAGMTQAEWAKQFPDMTGDQIAQSFWPGVARALRRRNVPEGLTKEEYQDMNLLSRQIIPALQENSIPFKDFKDAADIAFKAIGGSAAGKGGTQVYDEQVQQQLDQYGIKQRADDAPIYWTGDEAPVISGNGDDSAKTYTQRMESFMGVEMDALEEYFGAVNDRDVAVQVGGKIMPLYDYLKENGEAGLAALYNGEVKVHNLGENASDWGWDSFGSDGKLTKAQEKQLVDSGKLQRITQLVGADQLDAAIQRGEQQLQLEFSIDPRTKDMLLKVVSGQNGDEVTHAATEAARRRGEANHRE